MPRVSLDARDSLWQALGWLFALLLSCLCLTACAPPRSSRVVIGAKNFTEQVVLGELLAQEIEAVTGQSGGAAVLSGGELSVPAGSGERADRCLCGVHGDGVDGDFEAAAAAGWGAGCGAGVCDGEGVVCVAVRVRVEPGLGFENTFAMVVRGDDARRLGVRTISDAVRIGLLDQTFDRGLAAGGGV